MKRADNEAQRDCNSGRDVPLDVRIRRNSNVDCREGQDRWSRLLQPVVRVKEVRDFRVERRVASGDFRRESI